MRRHGAAQHSPLRVPRPVVASCPLSFVHRSAPLLHYSIVIAVRPPRKTPGVTVCAGPCRGALVPSPAAPNPGKPRFGCS
eukprot:890639-Rhodomonas_salina.1